MANTDDIDMTIDGFEPSLGGYAGNRRARPASKFSPSIDIDAPSYGNAEAEDENAVPKVNNRRKAANRNEQNKETRPQEENAPKAVSNLAVVRFFMDDRFRIFLGSALLILCFFIVVALISHFKNAAYDQSLVDNLSQAQLAAGEGQVRNAGGGFGAWLAKVLLCDSLGISSAVFIIYAGLLALAILGVKKVQFWSLTFKTLLVAVSGSIILGLVTYNSPTVLKWGGVHGHYINQFLISHTTWLGAVLVSALLILAVACVYLNELKIAWNRWRETVNRHKLQEELRQQRKRDLENVVDSSAESHEETKPENTSVKIDTRIQDIEEEEPEEPSRGFVIGGSSKPAFSIPKPEEPAATPTASFQIDNPAQADPSEKAPISTVKLEPEKEVETPAVTEPVAESEGFTVFAPEIEEAENPDDIDRGTTSQEPYDHRAELSRFRFPDIDLLEDRKSGPVIDMEEQQANKDRIVKTLLDYNISVSKIEATVGPTVTLYEIVPTEGVRISQIKRLEDDIAMSLSAVGIRIIAPIPGKGTVGIEVPNKEAQTVSMRSVITSKKYQECKMALPMAMGATISNDIFIADLAKMPHLLVAGATGMGKSVGLNAIVASLLYKKHPSELKFVLIDPKQVEFSLYSKLERHYMAVLPDQEEAIITDPSKVIQTLNSLCVEMENRLTLLKEANVRSIEEYNNKFTARKLNPKYGHKYLPFIVVIVDEFADLIMTAGKEIEMPIARIAQKARAVGIHAIIATQRPSTNVITGLIKANFPGRIAFRVIQMVDSRTILDQPGANQLIGRGDMLFNHNGRMDRVQCAFISTEEVEAITEWIGNQVGFEHPYYLPEYVPEGAVEAAAGANTGEKDALFDEAARFVVQRQIGSTSSLQRQFNIGYNRAGRLMDQMEAAGIIGPVNGAKPRNILMDSAALERLLGNSNGF